MSEPSIDPDLRIGRFLLDDIMRSLGGFQWFLTNISVRTQMSEPLLAEIMADLVHAAVAIANEAGPSSLSGLQRKSLIYNGVSNFYFEM